MYLFLAIVHDQEAIKGLLTCFFSFFLYIGELETGNQVPRVSTLKSKINVGSEFKFCTVAVKRTWLSFEISRRN